MSTKYAVVGMLVGGIILFLWGFITHGVIPAPVLEFKNEQAVLDAVRANAPSNGVYLCRRGLLAVVSFAPDMHDKTGDYVTLLLREFLSDCVTALLLAMVLFGGRSESVAGGAMLLTVAGLAAVFASEFSAWNWYGFSLPYVGIESLDLVGGWYLAGLALGALKKKMGS